MNKSFNVFLSGGGLKGAYQYGFFKQLYMLHPDFKINKMYASSVGALNAAPIMIKRVDLLDCFWNDKDKHPFETIIDEYNDNPYYLIQNITKKKSLFKGLQEKPFRHFWSKLNKKDIQNIRDNIIFVTFNQVQQKPFFSKCKDENHFYNLVKASTCHKLLFPSDNPLIDGKYVDFKSIESDSQDKSDWLILELGSDTLYDNKHIVYRPKEYCKSIMATFSLNKKQIQHIIDIGKEDASHFYESLLLPSKI